VKAYNRQASYQVLSQEIIPAPADILEKLVGQESISYSERYLPEEILPSLVDEDLTRVGSIHELLVGASEYPLLRAKLEIEEHLVNAEQARLLKASPGEPAIVVQRLTYTAPNRPAV
jgi:DNA-binding GntR family transcriptional regulator